MKRRADYLVSGILAILILGYVGAWLLAKAFAVYSPAGEAVPSRSTLLTFAAIGSAVLAIGVTVGIVLLVLFVKSMAPDSAPSTPGGL